MNILYISKLSGNPWAGPTYSVPEQIYAQSKVDNCFWLNLNHNKIDAWCKEENFFHNLDSGFSKIAELPIPFNKPDLAIVEQMYAYPFSKIIKELQREKIPYIIVPRGELCESSQKKKKIKKFFGNFIWFNRMIDRALAIEYLSENEFKNSTKWKNKKNLIIPNGINLPPQNKHLFSSDRIRATFIGRLDIYHKGLDLLLDAISLISDELKKRQFYLTLYGPSRHGEKDLLSNIIEEKKLQNLVSLKEGVYGKGKKEVLENTDLFILTSRMEGLPMALLEALSYGIPCLVTKGTNMGEEIENENAGWSAEVDVDSIKNAFANMLLYKDFSRMSHSAYELAKKYSWNSIADLAHNEYEKVLEQK